MMVGGRGAEAWPAGGVTAREIEVPDGVAAAVFVPG